MFLPTCRPRSSAATVRAVLCGIVATVTLTGYSIAAQWGWVQGTFHPYYTSILANLTMLVVCGLASLVFPAKERNLANLTIWRGDGDRPHLADDKCSTR